MNDGGTCRASRLLDNRFGTRERVWCLRQEGHTRRHRWPRTEGGRYVRGSLKEKAFA